MLMENNRRVNEPQRNARGSLLKARPYRNVSHARGDIPDRVALENDGERYPWDREKSSGVCLFKGVLLGICLGMDERI
jgi:hypothetical protein